MIGRIMKHFVNARRQIQAVLETDFFASSLKNDKAILAALESLVRGREKDQARLAALEKEVRGLRERAERETAPAKGAE